MARINALSIGRGGGKVSNPKNSDQTVNHHWFQEWSDHGVPQKDTFLDLVSSVTDKVQNPLIVHCSAGVGRTGTFILVDMMQRIITATPGLKNDEKLEVAIGILKYLRSCRTHMVQTEQQWKFALQALGIVEKPAA